MPKQVLAVGHNTQITTAANGQAQTGPNWQLLYESLLLACCQYFDPDAPDEQLNKSYQRIFYHMTNTADKLKVS